MLTGTGLAALLLRYAQPTDPEAPVVRAPSVTGTVAALEEYADAALAAADRVAALASAVDLGDELDPAALERAVAAGRDGADGARWCVRALGTVVLGVTSQQLDSAAVHLHDHVAAVGIVGASGSTRLGGDTWPTQGSTRAELLTEVAGICCRLLSEEPRDDHTYVAWELPNGSFVSVEGDTRGITVFAQDSAQEVPFDAGTEAVLRQVGWPEGTFHGPTLTASTDWHTAEDALVIAEIAGLVVGTLLDVLGAPEVAGLTRDTDLLPADTL